ncbi:hypothetical protein PFICI_14712 [Pestalotiopsis fici W106-1]|uniref:Uncharacterized protein n=1 Tax=Pestalotiopsis fici (strain W106-1 / CGMCC3.15140) TaxID=1229662 RepID=W3WLU2_PESFW|nr:uncharacterized protein PFICI_14712 [Pestalotiopsis fici W106-1]ETS73766.1 hypothetical protein PFICI_14712 [Pestalotiopsis fici W106-1]
MDEDSPKKGLNSSSIHSSITRVEESDQWWGHPPCVCCHSDRGCRQHNPAQEPTYYNTLLPPKLQGSRSLCRLLDTIWSIIQGTALPKEALETPDTYTKTEPLFFSSLPFDPLSVNTLTPIHPSMPYHLAFYHLDCIRRQLDVNVPIAFIPELSCSGIAHFYNNGPEYAWSSEVYFENGSFLQKQEISYVVEKGFNIKDIEFTECPHITFTVGRPSFVEQDGWQVAKSTIRSTVNGQPYCRSWTSIDGRSSKMSRCLVCHSDHEQILEVIGRQLHVRNTCYRDLGFGTDRCQPKWTALLTGMGILQQRNYLGHDQVFGRVWRTAKRLGRPNLHVVIHVSNHGEYDVSAFKDIDHEHSGCC